jgi:hypothetical protein
MADHYVRQGDSAASIASVLLDADGDPVNIADADIFIDIAPVDGGPHIVGSSATPAEANNDQTGTTDGTTGHVSYDWDTGETDDAGYFLVNWIVLFANQSVQTFPNAGSELLLISGDPSAVTNRAFATSADFEERIGVELTADEHRRAAGLLAKASDLIRAETGQTISLVEDDPLTLRGFYGVDLMLPERPVVGVASVTVGGVTLDAAGYYLQGNDLIRWGTAGWPQSGFGNSRSDVVVTYTHGYEEIPGDIHAVCLEMVARVWGNPGAVVSETVGNVQTTFSVQPVSGMLMTDEERRTVGRAIGQGVGSVQLR